MLAQILANTPRWVWILLIALLYLGLSQTRNRSVSLRKITIMPLAMLGFSLFGIYSAFGSGSMILLAWLAAGIIVFTSILSVPLSDDVRYDAQTKKFDLPGSWVPMALILGIFFTKYLVGAIASSHAALLHELGFSLSFSALYGAFSGAFLARAARFWRLAMQSPDLSSAQAVVSS
ncbi:DUF6622 family protein [Undibacterium sp. Ren11W]|uniref:DUF6622 family protein n=1 Tax=Undibacterium sp. Ren11W TaxID=3413045 RepID=UPI003BF42663